MLFTRPPAFPLPPPFGIEVRSRHCQYHSMELERRVEKLEQSLLGQQVVALTLTAEVNAVLALLRQLVTVEPSSSPQDAAEQLDAAFLEQRQKRLRMLLLLQEQTNPALAAKLSALLDDPGLNHPVKWE